MRKQPAVSNSRSRKRTLQDDAAASEVANTRKFEIMPSKINYGKSPSVAEDQNKNELEAIEHLIPPLDLEFEELERKRVNLDKFIEAVSSIEYQSDELKHNAHDHETGLLMLCFYCGIEKEDSKNFWAHVDRCFSLDEKQYVHENDQPANVAGTKLLCDFFNPANGKYCKKLDVRCPQHGLRKRTAFARIQCSKAVCGALQEWDNESPLDPRKFSPNFDVNKICRVLKKECYRHFLWEERERALIDHQKYKKLSQLKLRKEFLLHTIQGRGNLLDLLLNDTTAEEPN